jgi:hypothetical protein
MSQSNGVKVGRVEAIVRQDNGLSRTGSESDSLLDLYSQNGDKRGDGLPFLNMEDPESAKWIHRDKLARIESEELQQAGIRLPPQNQIRSGSKASRRTRSRDRSNSATGDQAEQWPSTREEKRQRVASPIPAEEQEQAEQDSWDLRTPEEIAADPYDDGFNRLNLKKTSSRIPVFSSSPLPVPQEHIERETPLQRKRNTSGSWNREEESIAYNKGRGRSHSGASQDVFDDADGNESPVSGSPPGSGKSFQQSSPSKSKAGKAGTASGGRKASAPGHTRSPSGGQQKQRTPSANTKTTTPTTRPVTRGNDVRPSTAVNRPEGDPPWLATMYKPDPRLPPDQQILPTHAKRLQQEQWEKEGKYPSTYDKEFAPLAVHAHDGLRQSTSPEPQVEQEKDEDAWPLKAAPKYNDANGGPETSGTDHGGYSTMPKVQNTPPIGMAPSPKIVQKPAKAERPPATRPLPGPPEEDELVGKGCGCCVVM